MDKQSWHYLLLQDRKSTRLNSSHLVISYAVFCLGKRDRARPPVDHRGGLAGGQHGVRLWASADARKDGNYIAAHGSAADIHQLTLHFFVYQTRDHAPFFPLPPLGLCFN